MNFIDMQRVVRNMKDTLIRIHGNYLSGDMPDNVLKVWNQLDAVDMKIHNYTYHFNWYMDYEDEIPIGYAEAMKEVKKWI